MTFLDAWAKAQHKEEYITQSRHARKEMKMKDVSRKGASLQKTQ
jgi:hypothetical protein